MSTIAPILRGIVAASAVPALVAPVLLLMLDRYSTLSSSAIVFLAGAIVAAGHVLLLGLPIAVYLRRHSYFRVLPLLASGFCIGLLPTLLLQFVQHGGSGAIASTCEADAACLAALATSAPGWPGYVVAPLVAGFLGITAALSFYLAVGHGWSNRAA